MTSGADDYLVKPFSEADLLATIEVRLRKSAILQREYGRAPQRLNEFIADGKTVSEIGDVIGADRLFYQTLEDLVEVTSIKGKQSWDTSCFNGEYVTGDVTQEYLDALEAARNDTTKSLNQKPEGTIELHNDE